MCHVSLRRDLIAVVTTTLRLYHSTSAYCTAWIGPVTMLLDLILDS